MSSSLRVIALVVLVALAAIGCRSPELPAIVLPPTPSPTEAPTPTPSTTVATPTPAPFEDEPGLTADVMRIAVIADGDTPDVEADGSESAWQAVEAWADLINERGGLANRRVEVSRVDSAVLRSAAAIDRVCNGDFFAVVGSASIIDNEGLDQLRSPGCRLPDFPARVSSVERLQSSTTFVSNPVNGSTWNAGFARYFAQAHPDGVATAATMLVDFPTLVVGGEQLIEAASAQGYDFLFRPVVDVRADYDALASDLLTSGARSFTWRNNSRDLIDLLRAIDAATSGEGAAVDDGGAAGEVGAAEVLENSLEFIDCGQRCYDQQWVTEAGDLAEGVSVWLPTLPFEETDLSPELLRYLLTMENRFGDDADPSALGVSAWSAALLFGEAVNRAVGAGTAQYDPDSLTRSAVIDAARSITEWTAHDLHGPANPADAVPSACFVVMTFVDGAWVRTYPSRRGAFDCDAANLVELEVTAEAPVEPTPTPQPTPGG